MGQSTESGFNPASVARAKCSALGYVPVRSILYQFLEIFGLAAEVLAVGPPGSRNLHPDISKTDCFGCEVGKREIGNGGATGTV